MLSHDEEALTTKFLEGGLGRNQRRFSDEDRRFLFGGDTSGTDASFEQVA